ncbi:hypothetical protein HNE_0450 [Hyphomonas neptunium ATCC 15444]|uniref:DUF4760 domain-containing protein n=2 Tax=Hyphomonas TaxID=85 RepID=Q0C513_HYPNA|nr:hypothetical protein HNE_0450 [Hyphomonas neptunium ATCC 15444]
MDAAGIFDWLKGNTEIIIGVLSAIVALASALVSRGETAKQRKLQTERLRQSIDAASLEWGGVAIDTLARCGIFARTRHLHGNDAAFLAARTNMLIQLSTLVDRGRMFFPNIDPDGKGIEKEGAYRGSRPPILDVLMFAYHEIESLNREGGLPSDDCAAFIDDCRRLLVSELQAHLDPRRLDEIVERYDDRTKENRQKAKEQAGALRGKLLTRRPNVSLDRGFASNTTTPERPQ